MLLIDAGFELVCSSLCYILSASVGLISLLGLLWQPLLWLVRGYRVKPPVVIWSTLGLVPIFFWLGRGLPNVSPPRGWYLQAPRTPSPEARHECSSLWGHSNGGRTPSPEPRHGGSLVGA
ncbi:hypothetical protein U1Q18_001641 [Sarracenia purpurea var. burkii]